jgi:hypothetical protein
MRSTTLVAVLILLLWGLAAAQEADDYYVNKTDGFKVYFPGQPKITDTTWTSQQNFTLPAHVYSVDKGKEHYVVTVVDYSGIEQMGIERVKTCPAGAPLCRGTALSGPGLWKHDVRGASARRKDHGSHLESARYGRRKRAAAAEHRPVAHLRVYRDA